MTNATKQPAKKVSPAPTVQQVAWKGFVRCDVSKAEIADLTAYFAATDDAACFDSIVKLVDSGYKFSVGEGKLGLTASLHNVEGPDESRGYMLTAMANTAGRATRTLLYKHFVKLDADWPTSTDTDDFDLR